MEPISRYTALVSDLRAYTLENFDTRRDRRLVNVRNAVIRFVQGEVSWVYLYGPPGNGKTRLAAANTLAARGRTVLFVAVPKLLAIIRDGFNAGQAENLTEVC